MGRSGSRSELKHDPEVQRGSSSPAMGETVFEDRSEVQLSLQKEREGRLMGQ